MAKVNIEVQASKVQHRIGDMLKAGENMTPVWQKVGVNVVNRIRMLFRQGRDPWGHPWKPLKWRAPRMTKRGKVSKAGAKQMEMNAAGTPGQPLVHTGMLRRSITAKADTAGVQVGTNLIYARVHQFGAKILPKKGPFLVFPGPNGQLIFARKVTVPARPFMPIHNNKTTLPKNWAATIIRMLATHLKLDQKAAA